MKKLLALILCVVMVMSLAPAAFAAGTVGVPATSGSTDIDPQFQSVASAKKAISDINDDMKAMYYAIVADQTVFGTAKTIYDFSNGLATELLKDVASAKNGVTGNTVYNEDLTANVRKYLNATLSDEIAMYMNKRQDAFTNGDGFIQPDKYLKVFADAVSSTLGSEKAQKNIEAIVYGLAALKLQKSVNDQADDLYDAIDAWDHWGEFEGAFGALIDPDDDDDGLYVEWLPADYIFTSTQSSTLGDDAAQASGALFYAVS